MLGTLPEKFRIIREITGDLLKDLLKLPEHLPEFSPKERYMVERKEKLDLGHMSNFLWPEEQKLVYWIMAEQNQAFAWEDNERGKFKEGYFLAIEIPMVTHIPWVERPFRIPPAIHDEVCGIIKRKIDAGIYKPSNSSYCSRWFCVIKKDGKSLHIVHSLEPMNRVTITHSGLPPATEELAMHFAERAYRGILDLYVGYDKRVLAERSRDLTTFQTPFGALRLVTLPMGWMNSVLIFHDDVTHILHDEIPRYTLSYINDVPIRGPATRYEKPNSTLEVLEKNTGIRQFIFKHMKNVNRILQRMKYAGGTFLGPKTKICKDHIIIVGFDCSYKGRKPTRDTIGKIMCWGPCEDTTNIRAFLGMAVQCRNHIPNFVMVALPLYEVIKKDVTFEWGPVQEKAQSDLKTLIELCFHTRNLKFPSEQLLVLAVDTSWRAVGYYMYQRDEEEPKRIHYVKFNSLLMDKRQQRYSQPKRELCGLRQALEQEIYLFEGCRDFIVETDAKYLAGMLNNPGKMPNATINHWVDYIRTNFFFELVHKKGKTFGPDGLSRRKWYPRDLVPKVFKDGLEDGSGDIAIRKEDPIGDDPLRLEEFYEEINSREGFYHGIILDDPLMTLGRLEARSKNGPETLREVFAEVTEPKGNENDEDPGDNSEEEELGNYDNNRHSDHMKRQEEMLSKIKRYLTTKDLSELEVLTIDQARFVRQMSYYWLDKEDGKLYRKNAGGENFQLVIGIPERMGLLKACYDKMGHQGAYATGRML